MRHDGIVSFKDLKVWQLAMRLVEAVYALTKNFPREEAYGLTSQMRRAAISIPSNIAEGHTRRGANDYKQFVSIALGSAAELETQVMLSCNLGYTEKSQTDSVLLSINEIRQMLQGLRRSLTSYSSKKAA